MRTSALLFIALCATLVACASAQMTTTTMGATGSSSMDMPGACDATFITLAGGLALSPVFDAATLTYTVPVTAAQAAGKGISTSFSIWAEDPMAVITYSIDGAVVFSSGVAGGSPNPVFSINHSQTLLITITCDSCVQTYTINFVCAPPVVIVTPPSSTGPAPPSTTGGFVVGDPQFSGLRGQSYQVHGVAGEVYNLISSSELQVNSKFVFLTSGTCPIINGIRAKGCFSHAGSYLGEIGIKTVAGDKIKIVSGSAASGFASVTLNNVPVAINDELVTPLTSGGFITRNSTHVLTIEAGNFGFVIENSDLYLNQGVSILDWNAASVATTHGLLGQTHSGKRYSSSTIKDIAGDVEDYTISDRDLFGNKFVYNRFPTTH